VIEALLPIAAATNLKKYRAVLQCGKESVQVNLQFDNDLSAAISLLGMVAMSNGATSAFELFGEDGSRICGASPWLLMAQIAPAVSEVSKGIRLPVAIIPKSDKGTFDLLKREPKTGGA